MNKQVAQASQERAAHSVSGFVHIVLGMAALLLAVAWVFARPGPLLSVVGGVAGLLGLFWCWGGLYMLQPNQAALLMFFGSYRGTDRQEGLRWANPFNAKVKLSVRARNFNSEKLKVNDLRGNPIEIAAAIVWRVDDTARASFDVQDFDA